MVVASIRASLLDRAPRTRLAVRSLRSSLGVAAASADRVYQHQARETSATTHLSTVQERVVGPCSLSDVGEAVDNLVEFRREVVGKSKSASAVLILRCVQRADRCNGDPMVKRTDTLTVNERSKRMALVRNKNTKPEIAVRRIVRELGFHYRLHVGSVPGRPDLVFRAARSVIFVHGCFWHRHPRCGRLPKSRLDFWQSKLETNRKRDLRNQRTLRRMGWRYFVVWECQLKNERRLRERIALFLEEK